MDRRHKCRNPCGRFWENTTILFSIGRRYMRIYKTLDRPIDRNKCLFLKTLLSKQSMKTFCELELIIMNYKIRIYLGFYSLFKRTIVRNKVFNFFANTFEQKNKFMSGVRYEKELNSIFARPEQVTGLFRRHNTIVHTMNDQNGTFHERYSL